MRNRLAEKIAGWQVKPYLAVILVGSDPASIIYDRNKQKAAQALEESGHFKTTVLYPGPSGHTYRWLGVEVLGEVSAQELKKSLLELDPGIVVGEWEGHSGVTVNTLNMEPDEVRPLVEGMIGCYESLAKGGAQE